MGLGDGKEEFGGSGNLPGRPEVMKRQLLARRSIACDDLTDEDRRIFWRDSAFFEKKSGDVVKNPWKAYDRGAVTLARGERIFRDAGVVFYKIGPGDVESVIIQKLARYPEFAYLKCLPRAKILGFNIPDDRFRIDEWIPLPLNPELMTFSDVEFAEDCRWALMDLQNDDRYGERLRALVKKVGEDELVATMIAFAKAESGDPIGTYAHYRCEAWQKNGIRDYSLSVFHIKMEAGGLLGRKHLGLTQGQMFHPRNAARVFLIFWLQKERDLAAMRGVTLVDDRLIPLTNDIAEVCDFYNGKGWRVEEDTPLRYDRKLLKYYLEAMAFLRSDTEYKPRPMPRQLPKPSPKSSPTIPDWSVPEHIRELQKQKRAVVVRSGEGMLGAMRRAGDFRSDVHVMPYVVRLKQYLRQVTYGGDYSSVVFSGEVLRPGDIIAFDRRRSDGELVLIFWRNGMKEEAWLRLPSSS